MSLVGWESDQVWCAAGTGLNQFVFDVTWQPAWIYTFCTFSCTANPSKWTFVTNKTPPPCCCWGISLALKLFVFNPCVSLMWFLFLFNAHKHWFWCKPQFLLLRIYCESKKSGSSETGSQLRSLSWTGKYRYAENGENVTVLISINGLFAKHFCDKRWLLWTNMLH